jgi:hypothetical protein
MQAPSDLDLLNSNLSRHSTPLAPPPPQGPLSVSPPPPAWPLPRPPSGGPVWVLVGVLVVLSLLFLGLFVYLGHPPGSNCNDWYVYCPTGPGATPLGTAIVIGNGTGECPVGNGTSPRDCAYWFSLQVDPFGQGASSIPSALALTFELGTPTYSRVNSTYLVALIDPGGGWIGTWNSSTSSWTNSIAGGECGGPGCLSTPLESGESLLLRSVPSGGLPYSHQGDHLRVEAGGAGFTGFVDAPID